MSATDDNRPPTEDPPGAEDHGPARADRRSGRRATKATKAAKTAKGEALRKAFGNGEGPAADEGMMDSPRRRAATTSRSRRQGVAQAGTGDGPGTVAETPTGEVPAVGSAHGSDRLVSEAVMAGLDAVSTARVRVPVGAGGGGGGLPPRPDEDESEDDGPRTLDDAVTQRGTTVPVVAPQEGEDEELDAIIARSHRHGTAVHPLQRIGKALNSFITEAGELTAIGGQVFKSAVTQPRGYWGDVRDQLYDGIKLCWVPMVIAVGGFGFGAPGLQGGNILYLFGVPDRVGGFMMFASIREFAPFVEGMVVAGVVGTAITADLGARRIREEIDAMEVLGVDPVRKLVLPRVISTTILTAFLDLFALFVGIIGGFFAGLVLGSSPAGYVASFFSESNISDDWGSFVKCAVFGVIIGLVCCFKGYRAKGGPAGVGRAVNQAVVISFALIWVTDYTFTNLLLGYAPSTQLIK